MEAIGLKKFRCEVNNQSNYCDVLELEIAIAAADDMELDFKHDQLTTLQGCVGKLQAETSDLVALRYFKKRSCKEITAEKNGR